MGDLATWAALAGLGAFHGLNPGMGWLFALALGLQRRSRTAVLSALPPIALGHALAVGAVVALVLGLRVAVPEEALRIGSALVIAGFAVYRIVRRRHLRWAGMQVGCGDLILWSFLMASAHGAGLMLAPILMGSSAICGIDMAVVDGRLASSTPLGGVTAVGIHTGAHLGVATVLALVFYETAGLRILRYAWFNIDRIWVGVLLLTAVAVLLI